MGRYPHPKTVVQVVQPPAHALDAITIHKHCSESAGTITFMNEFKGSNLIYILSYSVD